MFTCKQFDVICARRNLQPTDADNFLKLANEGKIDDPEFGIRLATKRNYKKAAEDVMVVLAGVTK